MTQNTNYKSGSPKRILHPLTINHKEISILLDWASAFNMINSPNKDDIRLEKKLRFGVKRQDR